MYDELINKLNFEVRVMLEPDATSYYWFAAKTTYMATIQVGNSPYGNNHSQIILARTTQQQVGRKPTTTLSVVVVCCLDKTGFNWFKLYFRINPCLLNIYIYMFKRHVQVLQGIYTLQNLYMCCLNGIL